MRGWTNGIRYERGGTITRQCNYSITAVQRRAHVVLVERLDVFGGKQSLLPPQFTRPPHPPAPHVLRTHQHTNHVSLSETQLLVEPGTHTPLCSHLQGTASALATLSPLPSSLYRSSCRSTLSRCLLLVVSKVTSASHLYNHNVAFRNFPPALMSETILASTDL